MPGVLQPHAMGGRSTEGAINAFEYVLILRDTSLYIFPKLCRIRILCVANEGDSGLLSTIRQGNQEKVFGCSL